MKHINRVFGLVEVTWDELIEKMKSVQPPCRAFVVDDQDNGICPNQFYFLNDSDSDETEQIYSVFQNDAYIDQTTPMRTHWMFPDHTFAQKCLEYKDKPERYAIGRSDKKPRYNLEPIDKHTCKWCK